MTTIGLPRTERPHTDWRPLRRLALLGLVPVAGIIALGTLGSPSLAFAACDLLLRLVGRLPGTGWPTDYTAVQAWANVAMFVPVGLLLALGTRPSRWPVVVLLGPAAAAAIETAQRWIPGRVPDAADLVLNGAGAVSGFLAGASLVGLIALGAGLRRMGTVVRTL